jgi:biopolymer transport protein ExbB
MNKPTVVIALIAVIILAVFAGTVFAQDGGKDKEAVADKTLGDIIMDGGVIGWVIILLSIVSLALAIEHFVSVRRDKIVPPELIDEVEALFEEEEYQEALELCEAEPNFLTNVLSAGLPKINAGFEAMEKSMDEVAEEESIKLHQKIGWLSLIGNIAPMLGLFGTVLGMIQAFNEITRLGSAVTPRELSAGISTALITTLFGLFVAMPSLFFFFLFRNKVIKVSLEITAIAADLVERFRPQAS